jgi:hypothetical protein
LPASLKNNNNNKNYFTFTALMQRIKKKFFCEPGMVAHACNPNYFGGRDWEDGNSKPV